MNIRKDTPSPRLPLRGWPHPSKASPDWMDVLEVPVHIAALHIIPLFWSNPPCILTLLFSCVTTA